MRRNGARIAALLIMAACARGDDDAAQQDTSDLAESAELAADLLAPVRSVSVTLVDASDAAMQRASREDVRQFAITLAADHRAVVTAIDSIVRERNLQLTETEPAQELSNAVRMAHAGLDELETADHDLAFVRAQVESHRQVLDRIELELLPGATSPWMQQLLGDVKAMEDAHLTRARQLLAAILGRTLESGGTTQSGSPAGPPAPLGRPAGGG